MRLKKSSLGGGFQKISGGLQENMKLGNVQYPFFLHIFNYPIFSNKNGTPCLPTPCTYKYIFTESSGRRKKVYEASSGTNARANVHTSKELVGRWISKKRKTHIHNPTHSQAVFSVRRGEFKSFERPLFLDNRAFFQRRENALMLFLVNDTGACCSHGSGKIPVVSTRPLGVF